MHTNACSGFSVEENHCRMGETQVRSICGDVNCTWPYRPHEEQAFVVTAGSLLYAEQQLGIQLW